MSKPVDYDSDDDMAMKPSASRFEQLVEEEFETKEAFLENDKAIPGQNYVCLSFVTPKKVGLIRKEFFYFYNFYNHQQKKQKKLLKDLDKMMNDALTGQVDVSQLAEFRKKMGKKFEEFEFENFKEKVLNFDYVNHAEIEKQYFEYNEFRTSVCGLKVRGTFDTEAEAKIRCKVLQRMDPIHNIFVGRVGYWLPWDPEGDDIQDEHHLNEGLDEVVQQYKKNQTKKDLFFQEQVRERKQQAIAKNEADKKKFGVEERDVTVVVSESAEDKAKREEADRLAEEQLKKTTELYNDTTVAKEMLTEEGGQLDQDEGNFPLSKMSGLTEMDPWMQRKLEEEAAKKAESETQDS